MPAPSASALRAMKRNRVRRNPRWEPDSGLYAGVDLDSEDRRAWEPRLEFVRIPAGPHAPAKAEARVLRRLCAQTGLTPEEVRARKVYRQQLAQAAQASERATRRCAPERLVLRVLKDVLRETGMTLWNPGLPQAFIQAWEQRQGCGWMSSVAAMSPQAALALVRKAKPLLARA